MAEKSELSTLARKLLRKLISNGGKNGIAISRRNKDAAQELETLGLGFGRKTRSSRRQVWRQTQASSCEKSIHRAWFLLSAQRLVDVDMALALRRSC